MLSSDRRTAIAEAIERNAGTAKRISEEIHANPELMFEEFDAVELLTRTLKEQQFTVERPLGSLDTAFRAVRGDGDPTVAILCEYDALPEIGHGCGHNLIAAGGWLAGVAAATAWSGPGRVEVIGTPAEEGGGGKILLLQQGMFDDVDAVLMFHPTSHTRMIRHAAACQSIDVTFHGTPAHAAGAPHEGRSALAAVIQLFTAVDAMRQFIPDTARIHGVVTDGGGAANVVPGTAAAHFQVRDLSVESTEALIARFEKIAEGCALATETRLELAHGLMYTERKNNHTMADRVADHLTELGVAVEPSVLKGGTGSSDIGNVSLAVPTIHPYLKIMPGSVGTHTADMAGYAAGDAAFDATVKMAEALACTAVELLEDPTFLAAARDEFDRRGPDYAE